MNNWNENSHDLRNNLKTGHVVRTRSNDLFFIVKDCDTELYDHQEFCLVNSKRILHKVNFNHELNAYPVGSSSNPDDIVAVYGNGKIRTDAFSLNVKNMPIVWERKLKEVQLEDVIQNIQDEYGDEIILVCKDETAKEKVKNMMLKLEV